MANPRVFTIPASAPFVPTLIRALVDGTLVPGFPAGEGPLALADATLYLPTRRACRLVRDVFLDVTKASAAILPRIVAIGDVDEDEIAFAQAATGALAGAGARSADGGWRARAAAAADATRAPVGREHYAGQERRSTARRRQSGVGARARGRPRSLDGRHDHTRSAMGPTRRTRPGSTRPLLAAHARIPEDRPRDLAEHPRRTMPPSSRPPGATP